MEKVLKLKLPDHIGEITLGQYQEDEALKADKSIKKSELYKRRIALYCGIDYSQLQRIKKKDCTKLLNQIDTALTLTPAFENRFTMDGVEYGFIPNLDKIELDVFEGMSFGEFVDGEAVADKVEELHHLMAILFRPVTKSDRFGNYQIEEYNGTFNTAEKMKGMPLSIVNMALDFFLRLSQELGTRILMYMPDLIRERGELLDTLKNGDGTQRLVN